MWLYCRQGGSSLQQSLEILRAFGLDICKSETVPTRNETKWYLCMVDGSESIIRDAPENEPSSVVSSSSRVPTWTAYLRFKSANSGSQQGAGRASIFARRFNYNATNSTDTDMFETEKFVEPLFLFVGMCLKVRQEVFPMIILYLSKDYSFFGC